MLDANAAPTRFRVVPDLEQHYGAPIVSPIDGSHITSRSQLRAHEITHQVRHGGDYKPGDLAAKANKAKEDRLRKMDRKGVSFEWQ